MAITTPDGWVASAKQLSLIHKTARRTATSCAPFTVFDLAGYPGAGTLAVGNTANGLVPTDATAGFPAIAAFGGGATGYLSNVRFTSSVAGRAFLFDRLFHAGAYAFNANTNLASQPSFSGRVPGGTDFTRLEIWVEQVTAATGNQAVNVTYVNEGGTGSRTTGATGIGAAPSVGRMWQLPLQAGDEGVQQITNVTGSVASAGTFNVLVLRRLWSGRLNVGNQVISHDFARTGMPQIFADSALMLVIQPDSTATGIPEAMLNLVNG